MGILPARSAIKRWLPPAMVDAYRAVRGALAPAAPPPAARPEIAPDSPPRVDFRLKTSPLAALFQGIERLTVEVPVSGIVRPRDMVLPLPELLVIAGLCKFLRPRRIFEIGTYTGATTLIMAMNAPPETRITTLDIDAGNPLVGSCFRASAWASRIRQEAGDSQTFTFGPHGRSIDLVFIDASHAYESVKNDTLRAFEILAPGGVIIWDDYRWLPEHRECADVTRLLNELAETHACHAIEGTRLAVYLDRPNAEAHAP